MHQNPDSELSFVEVLLDSAPLTQVVLDNLLDVSVEQDLFLPDACTLRFLDVRDQPSLSAQGFYQLLDEDRFRIGAHLQVKLGHERSPDQVFDGEITAVELDLDLNDFPTVTVRGFDRSHRLRRARKTRAFVNASDSDIARQVASGYGLTCQAQPSGVVHPHVFQDNQTDWEFLRARAARIGWDVRVDGSQLSFAPPGHDRTTLTLTRGAELLRARVRLSAQGQVAEVTVRGWDPSSKSAVVGRASEASTGPRVGERRSGAALSDPFGRGSFVLTERFVGSQSDADHRAQALYDRIAGDFIQVDGTARGDARLRPGRAVDLRGLGRRFSGTYPLSAVTHRRRRGEAYVSTFAVNGRRPSTLAASLAPTAAAPPADAPVTHPSVVIGLVTHNADPDSLGRVRVKFPWLDGSGDGSTEGVSSTWARVATPMAGPDRGFIWLPEVNDEVLVAFEHGDINRPFVVGCVWNGREHPPSAAGGPLVGQTGKVDRRLIKSRTGHSVVLDDSETSPGVIVTSKGGHQVAIDDSSGGPKVQVRASSGHTIVLDGQGISLVDASGANSVRINASTNEVQVKAAANLRMEAVGQVTLKGATVSVEASGPFTVKGATGTVQATGPLAVKGAMVAIN